MEKYGKVWKSMEKKMAMIKVKTIRQKRIKMLHFLHNLCHQSRSQQVN